MENYCATVGELNLNVKLTGETVRIYSFLFFFFPFTVLIHSYRHNYMERFFLFNRNWNRSDRFPADIVSLSRSSHLRSSGSNRFREKPLVSSHKRFIPKENNVFNTFLPSYQLFTRSTSRSEVRSPFRRKGNFLAPSMTSEILSKLTHSMYK